MSDALDRPWRAELIARHGQPTRLDDRQAALSFIGVTGVSPDHVYASVYRDADAAAAWLAANLKHYGHPSLGTAELPGGAVVGVLDLRPALARAWRAEGH